MKNKLFAFGAPDRLKAIFGGFMSLVILGGLVSLNFNILPTSSFESFTLSASVADIGEPRIREMSPPEAAPGEMVRLSGLNFHGDTVKNQVFFGDTKAKITNVIAAADGSGGLDVVVPTLPAGEVAVRLKTYGGETTFGGSFTVKQGAQTSAATTAGSVATGAIPAIYRMEPTSLAVGEALYIFGDNFNPTAAENEIRFGTVRAAEVSGVYVGEEAALKVIVPAGAESGRVSVSVHGRTVESVDRVVVAGSASAQSHFAPGAPVVDDARAFTLPAEVSAQTTTFSFFTFVSDPDGAADITVVNANLAAIGGGPSNRLTPGELEGTGRFFSLENITLANPLDASKAPYTIQVSATDTSGNVGRGEVVICMDRCGNAEVVADQATDEVEIIAEEPAAMAAPTDVVDTPATTLRVEATGGYLTLGWDEAHDALEYYVYYGSAADALLHRLPVVSGAQAFVTDLNPGQRYFFAVSAVDVLGIERELTVPTGAIFPHEVMHNAAPVVVDLPTTVDTELAVEPVPAGAVPTDMHGAAPAELGEVGPAETALVSLLLASLGSALFYWRSAVCSKCFGK